MEMPDDLATALKKVKGAKEAFAAMSPSHQKEWLKAINDAKRDETRKRRVDDAVRAVTGRGKK